MCRRCGEPDRRGSAADRRGRKRWLLKTFGDGRSCPCTWCGTTLNWATLQHDRLVPEGPYRRDNLVPACGPCNIARIAATIPDGCEYGPVGDLTTNRHGRYTDETPVGTARADDDSTREGPDTTPSSEPRRGDHQAAPEDDGEPDLVVIDTANLDDLRVRHPWLFTTEHQPESGHDIATTDARQDEDGTLAGIDAHLYTAKKTLNAGRRRAVTTPRIEDADDRQPTSGWAAAW